LTLLPLMAAGCGQGDLFAQFPERESADVASAPYPELVDGVGMLEASGPGPDPAGGAAIVESRSTEAALAQADAERVGAAVFEVEALRSDADAVRRGP
jgi:hypothetical protein